MRSLAPITRPLFLAPRAARAEPARLSDNPAPPAVFKKSLRPNGSFSSGMVPPQLGIPSAPSVAPLLVFWFCGDGDGDEKFAHLLAGLDGDIVTSTEVVGGHLFF